MEDFALESKPQIISGNSAPSELKYLSKSALTKIAFKGKKNLFPIKFLFSKVISITISPSLKYLASEWSTPVNQDRYPNAYFSNDEKFLITGSLSNLIKVHLFKDKTIHFVIELLTFLRSKSPIIISCSTKNLAIISPQSILKILDMNNKEIIDKKEAKSFETLCISNCDQLLAFADSTGLLSISDLKDFHSKISIENTNKVVSIAFSPNSKLIAFKQEFSYITVWEIEINREIYRIIENIDDDLILDFSTNGNFLFGIRKDTIYILRQLKNINSCSYRKFDRKSYSYKKVIYCGRSYFLIGNDENEFNICDLKRIKYECYVVKDKIGILDFSPDNQWLAISHNQEVTIENLRESNRRIFVREFMTFIKYICFSCDSNMIAYGCGI